MTEIDRTSLRSAALQAVFMNDADGVATALAQLDQMELKGLYEDTIKLASWVEGRLEQVEPTARETSIWNRDPIEERALRYPADVIPDRDPKPYFVDLVYEPDQMFQTGPSLRLCGAHGQYECSVCYPSQP